MVLWRLQTFRLGHTSFSRALLHAIASIVVACLHWHCNSGKCAQRANRCAPNMGCKLPSNATSVCSCAAGCKFAQKNCNGIRCGDVTSVLSQDALDGLRAISFESYLALIRPPTLSAQHFRFSPHSWCTPCGTRTRNLRIRSPTPCPLGQGGIPFVQAIILYCKHRWGTMFMRMCINT